MKKVLLVPFVLCLCVSCSSTPDRPASTRSVMTVSPVLDRTQIPAEPVSAIAHMNPLVVAPGATGLIDVFVRVQPGWYIYPTEVNGDGIPMKLAIDSGDLFATDGPWLMPPPKPGRDGPMYTGNIQFRRKIRVSGRAASGRRHVATITFTYQVCDSSDCLPPKTLPLTVEYAIGRSN
ncbi:MAG: protein-disulfide reductase DsbD domain-containing protein [Candidatus Hydrogenedentota bacterium]